MTLEKVYQPAELETKWYQTWEKAGYFKPQAGAESYCIMLPPPNVTGTLHMGHAFQDTLMDALIRYNRMMGKQTLWQGGTDHAGIATQMVVERQLLKNNITRYDLGRERFIEKVWEWKAQSGNTISQQMRRLGASLDWSRERFTMDEGLSEAVKTVFIQLYEEDLIYRGTRLVNWDPKLLTAVSDLEVVSEEEDGFLWHIRYPLVSGKGFMIVATTRPETLLGDVAVAVHPNDERYQHLIGEKVRLPLCDREIPIIADDFVLTEFGTGCVKITPAHDFNDHQVGKRHHLEMINIFTPHAKINENAPKAYQGLDRFEARKKIVADLKDLLEKVEPYRIKVPRGDRTHEIIEPYLTPQWFVKTKPLAEPAKEAVTSGKISFVPENWSRTYFEWMNNIEDWCISRQIWWGHQIPAWYDTDNNIYVGESETAIRKKYQLAPEMVLNQDQDVLDTWFSSALWPFSTLGWPEKTAELRTFYPTNVLVTGFDILFFWVARMIMMGLKFGKAIPFKQVYVHGLIQDANGQKMSKSKGNIIDPLDLIDGITLDALVEKRTSGLMQPEKAKEIEKDTKKQYPEGLPSFGTDALRFTFCALASNNRHIRFDLARVEGYRNFCNKIWNAARYVFMNVEGEVASEKTFSIYDRWIWSLLQKTKQKVHEHIAQYRFDLVAQTLYDFVWNHYCDWYLELSKPILWGEQFSPEMKNGTRFTLVSVLEEMMRLLHPMMPFITEEIWQKIPGAKDSVMIQPYPLFEENKVDEKAELAVSRIQGFIMGVRTIRGEMNLNQTVPEVILKGGSAELKETLRAEWDVIKKLAKIDMIKESELIPVSATALVEDLEIHIPLAGLIDKEVEVKRLSKEMDRVKKDLELFERKLNNDDYVRKAPPEVVEKERERLQTAQMTLTKLNENYRKISAL